MAKRKFELEADRDEYLQRHRASQAAIADGKYADAVQIAVSTLPLIDSMMQYERKYEDRGFDSVGAVETILKYGPLLLDGGALDAVGAVLDEYRRIERDTAADMGAKLDEARGRLWQNHRLLHLLMKESGTRQDDLRKQLGGEQEYWRTTVQAWVGMGLLRREADGISYRLFIGTDLQRPIRAKCASCGAVGERTTEQWLGVGPCSSCGNESAFVYVDQGRSSEG